MKETKKNKGKTKKEQKKDKRNVYYMLQGGLLLWLKLDSRWSCYCVDFNAFTYKWQRKGENCKNKRVLRHRKYRMAFPIVESSKNSLEKEKCVCYVNTQTTLFTFRWGGNVWICCNSLPDIKTEIFIYIYTYIHVHTHARARACISHYWTSLLHVDG